jgi:hypothetical protein
MAVAVFTTAIEATDRMPASVNARRRFIAIRIEYVAPKSARLWQHVTS